MGLGFLGFIWDEENDEPLLSEFMQIWGFVLSILVCRRLPTLSMEVPMFLDFLSMKYEPISTTLPYFHFHLDAESLFERARKKEPSCKVHGQNGISSENPISSSSLHFNQFSFRM